MENNKRQRANGTYRWSEKQTKDLIEMTEAKIKSNPECFEKPTAQKFYERISASVPEMSSIKWKIMRSKMRHLRQSYMKAIKWKKQTGARLLENGDEKSVQEYTQKMCPYYNNLEAIFGQRISIQPTAVNEPSQANNVEALEEDILNKESNVELVHSSDCENEIKPFDYNMTQQSLTTEQSSSKSPCSSKSASHTTESYSARKRNLNKSNRSSAFAMLIDIHKKKVEFETEKLELEKIKEANSFKIRKLELEKEERIEMEKLRLEKQERLTKYELELSHAK